MSFLDLYTKDQVADARIQPNEAHDLPATFSQGFDAAWSEGRLFGQSISGENARMDALQDHLDDVERKTGKRIADKIDWSGFAFGGAPTADMLREMTNTEAEKVDAPTLSADDMEQRAIAKSRAAQKDFEEISAREKTFGGKVGMFAGGVASSATDPINLLALPIAPETEGVGILAAALRWGAVGAGAQTAIEAAGAPYHEEVQPGYGVIGQPLYNIAEAFGGGAILGGVTKALGNAWTRVKTGQWPQSVRDAGNVIESEANVSNTNVYPGASGEVANREALTKTIDDVTAGRPVDVESTITPELTAAREKRLDDILGAREEAISAQKEAQAERAQIDVSESPDLPFQQTAKEAEMEGHLGDVAFGVQRLAKDAGYAMPRDEADRIAGRIAAATDDEARQILDAVSTNPQTIDTVLADAAKLPKDQIGPEPIAVEPAEKVTASPEYEKAVRADIDRERMAGDRKIPIDVGKDGEPVYRSLDSAMDEVDALKTAADHIQACANPEPEEKAA